MLFVRYPIRILLKRSAQLSANEILGSWILKWSVVVFLVGPLAGYKFEILLGLWDFLLVSLSLSAACLTSEAVCSVTKFMTVADGDPLALVMPVRAECCCTWKHKHRICRSHANAFLCKTSKRLNLQRVSLQLKKEEGGWPSGLVNYYSGTEGNVSKCSGSQITTLAVTLQMRSYPLKLYGTILKTVCWIWVKQCESSGLS